MNAEHRTEIKDPRQPPRVPEILAARCSCGWNGPLRTGRNARAMARTDEIQHLEREAGGANSPATP
jgi:hypothetical protein